MLRDLMEPLLNNLNPGDIPGDGSNPPALEPILESVELVEHPDSTVPSDPFDQRAQYVRHRLLSAMVLPNFDSSEVLPKKLQARISDYVFWINLVSRLGFDASVYQPSSGGVPSLENLSRYFDSTQLGMLRVFHLFDKDHDQTITNAEIAHGLRQQGLYTLQGKPDADEAFAELCGLMSEEDGFAHPPEFLASLRNLRLAAIVHDRQLSPDITGHEICVSLHEYREDQLYSACPMEHPVAFLFKPNTLANEIAANPALHVHVSKSSHLTGGASHHVRWLHLHEPGRKAILGLAVKYGLDPRFVLDVFTLWREQAKVDQVSTYDMQYGFNSTADLPRQVGSPAVDRPLWFFVVVPVLRLSEHSRETLRPYQAWRRSVMRQRSTRGGRSDGSVVESEAPCVEVVIEHCNLAMFVSGIAEGGTVLSFSSEWVELMKLSTVPSAAASKKGNDTTVAASKPEPHRIGSQHSSTWNTPLTFDRSGDVQLSMFSKVLSQIRTSYSRLRTGDAHTFLLKVLCDLTEDYLLIAQAYDACLLILQKRLDKEKDKLVSKDVRRIQKSIMQLSQLYRIVRPVATLADTFTSRQQWSGDAMLYVSDIRSNVSRFLEDVSASKENAKSISDQYHQFSEAKTSSVLYVLTLVTTVFVPGQFLTGLYGMNFVDDDGKPSIPELTWEHGYLFFWLVLIIITSITFIFYRRQRWI
jgi:Mg2+ and Co2+ transporter CorA